MNKDSSEVTLQLELPEQFNETELEDLTKTEIENVKGYITITLQPYSFAIIQSK